jgi:hypothetical protein
MCQLFRIWKAAEFSMFMIHNLDLDSASAVDIKVNLDRYILIENFLIKIKVTQKQNKNYLRLLLINY